MKANTGMDITKVAGSIQWVDGNNNLTTTVEWFFSSPTGDSTDSLIFKGEYTNSTPEAVLEMRKMVHANSTHPECPPIR